MSAACAGFSRCGEYTSMYTLVSNSKYIAYQTPHTQLMSKLQIQGQSCVPTLYRCEWQGFKFNGWICVLISRRLIWAALHCKHNVRTRFFFSFCSDWYTCSFKSVQYYPAIMGRIQVIVVIQTAPHTPRSKIGMRNKPLPPSIRRVTKHIPSPLFSEGFFRQPCHTWGGMTGH